MKKYSKEIINGRVTLVVQKGYVMTDGDKLYSRRLILEVGAEVPTLNTITETEYEAILAEQERQSRLEAGLEMV